ncbi:hypothetical protein NW733_04275 [Mycoplasmopsis felis]|nr:hypothetical protein [Mycoplasmopsis felis]MCU9931867.1 hypothetical protein [Mycoplasmopsis felis]
MDKKVNIKNVNFLHLWGGIPPQKKSKKEKYVKDLKAEEFYKNISRI